MYNIFGIKGMAGQVVEFAIDGREKWCQFTLFHVPWRLILSADR
jgi:hypothetical protein